MRCASERPSAVECVGNRASAAEMTVGSLSSCWHRGHDLNQQREITIRLAPCCLQHRLMARILHCLHCYACRCRALGVGWQRSRPWNLNLWRALRRDVPVSFRDAIAPESRLTLLMIRLGTGVAHDEVALLATYRAEVVIRDGGHFPKMKAG